MDIGHITSNSNGDNTQAANETSGTADVRESISPRPKEEDAKEQDVIEVEKKDDEPAGAVQEEVHVDQSKKKKKNKKGKKKDTTPPKEVENPYEQVQKDED